MFIFSIKILKLRSFELCQKREKVTISQDNSTQAAQPDQLVALGLNERHEK